MEERAAIIVAMDRSGLIGRAGGLPWHVPEDLRHFRAATMGHAVVMGRVTFERLPRVLDGRMLIVLTRRADYVAPEGVAVAHAPGEAVAAAGGRELFVAGGAEVYRAFLPVVSRLLVTTIPGEHVGDAWFPVVDWREWELAGERRAASGLGELLFSTWRRTARQ